MPANAMRTAAAAAAWLLIALGSPAATASQDALPSPAIPPAHADDGPAYPVSVFNLRYLHQGHPGHPKRQTLLDVAVTLGRTSTGFVTPRPDTPTVTFRLAEVADRPLEHYHASALQTVLARVRDTLAAEGLIGLYVAPDPTQITPTGRDERPAGRTALRLIITTALVTDVRTLASGERIDAADRLDHPLHRRLAARSPFASFDEERGDRRDRADLLNGDRLDAFLRRQSRHPGRRVDAALSPGADPGTVTLDYLITENDPLVLYAQISNTGTASTGRLLERFGLVHNQISSRDDILAIDYVTHSFDEVNAVTGSYEAPFLGLERLRWRVAGSWSEFTASQLGFFRDIFTGTSFTIGGELIANVHQDGNLFVDLVAGLRRDRERVDNELLGLRGEQDFDIAHVGVRFEREEKWYQLAGALTAEWNDGQDPQPDPTQLNRLGRLFPDPNFGIIRWDFGGSVYLEPLFDRVAWEDPSTPESSTLAHELVVGFRGQYAFDNRLVPQFEQVIGGFRSVRGYPESAAAGDSVIIGSVEYRYHLPRALAIEPTPAELFGKPFRVAPQNVYGRPDWDLILRAFCDVGRTFINDALPFEAEETFIGAGIGIELLVQRNLNLRVDWGFALKDGNAADVSAGSNRASFVATLFF
ncbi:MAG: ShlB/FhaC/HecB family hemolysin secretion/activation protein [Phycisphaerales bacterium]|nr:ShlB/FhaC/HecB family hemolysin secretion/activation protein [Phycisphaerales bacterium]